MDFIRVKKEAREKNDQQEIFWFRKAKRKKNFAQVQGDRGQKFQSGREASHAIAAALKETSQPRAAAAHWQECAAAHAQANRA